MKTWLSCADRRRGAALGWLAFLGVFGAGRHALGETIIDGGVVGGQRWSPAGSPYFVRGDVSVPFGTTLTIDPGVVVEFASSDLDNLGSDANRVEILVTGTLAVSGTAQTITFRARTGGAMGIWAGIRLTDASNPTPPQPPGASAIIDGAVIENAAIGVLAGPRSSLNARRVTLQANNIGIQTGAVPTDLDRITATANGIGVFFNGTGSLTNSTLAASVRGTTGYVGDGAGLFANPLSQQALQVRDCRFDRNYYNVYLLNGATVIANSILTNAQYGLMANGGSIVPVQVTNSTFDVNYYGIYHSTGIVRLTNSILTNGHYGVVSQADTLATTTYSNVWNNSSANFVNAVAGTGAISLDPRYVSATDVHLQSSSPCIDSGIGPGPTTPVPDHDLDQRPRPLDGNGVTDSDGSEYDMGAYEFPAGGSGGMGGAGGGGGGGGGGLGGSAGSAGSGGASGGGVGGAGAGGSSGGGVGGAGAGGSSGAGSGGVGAQGGGGLGGGAGSGAAGAGGVSGSSSGGAGAGGLGGAGSGGAAVGGANGAGSGGAGAAGASGAGLGGGGLGGDAGEGGVNAGGEAGTTSTGGAGGTSGAGAAGASGGGSGGAGAAAGSGGSAARPGGADSEADESSCDCRTPKRHDRSRAGGTGALALLFAFFLRRRRRR